MTRHNKKSRNGLDNMGQDDAMSRIHYPFNGPMSRHADPGNHLSTSEGRQTFLALVNRTGRNELRRQLPAEWKAFCGMMERKRSSGAVVDPLLTTFRPFLRCLGPCPSPDHYTLDRIDTFDPEYAPGKVRWATPSEQANNRRSTIFLDFEGQKLPLTVVAKKIGELPDTLRKRLRDGWTPEEVVAGQRRATVDAMMAAAADVSDGSGRWPKNVTLSRWSAPFPSWREALQRIGQASGASEAVFVAWITKNQSLAFAATLRKHHGLSFRDDHLPEAFNPELPAALRADPVYREFIGRLRGCKDAEQMVAADPTQCDRLAWLRKTNRQVTDPARAPAAFRSSRPRN